MSTATEIERLQIAKSTLKSKGVELGVVNSTDKLDVIATKFEQSIVNRGAISATVKEGETYTVPKGYHNGSGTVSGTSGGGNYTLQSKQVTPTKSQQNVTPDSGFYGLSDVTVKSIPAAYQDISVTTAAAADVLVSKTFVAADGTVTGGTMPNIGTVTATIDGINTTSYTIAAGKHSGNGTVSLTNDIELALSEI